MYLEHFGLKEPPFKITPVTDFFFPGANRGEILDALIYAITRSEGIIKVTGEVGSGKTMSCRMLLEKLPSEIEAIYLANPSLSREEMLYAIADGLKLDLNGQRVNVIMQSLQNLLAKKSAEGKRVVVLVDEAHAMPLDTLEELRLLYNLQLGDHKLLQIVLFGQPELNHKLSQPNMRQLKDRIVHHFSMLPLSKSVVESYLLFRMRTAGYHGPNIFSSAAVKLIGTASDGLMRRVNILADKSLLAAFVENTHDVEAHHVQAAIRDSELVKPPSKIKRSILITGSVAALVAGASWFYSQSNSMDASNDAIKISSITLPAATPIAIPAVADTPPLAASEIVVTQLAAATQSEPAANPEGTLSPPLTASAKIIGIEIPETAKLLAQRVEAAHDMFAKRDNNSASIQLFYTTALQPERVEDFLARAKELGLLADIYVLPTQIDGKNGVQVLYGNYPDSKSARAGRQQLPQRYKESFALAIYLLDSGRTIAH